VPVATAAPRQPDLGDHSRLAEPTTSDLEMMIAHFLPAAS
jgi:hypothetical protein